MPHAAAGIVPRPMELWKDRSFYTGMSLAVIATHKRLMLLATISILDAAIARWPLVIMATGPGTYFAIADLYIVAGAVYDLSTRGRVHPAYIWGGFLIVASQIARLAVWHTAWWIAFVRILAATAWLRAWFLAHWANSSAWATAADRGSCDPILAAE